MKPGIGRRQFMQRSLVGAAAAPMIVHVLGEEATAAQTVAANDRIQVGIIGVGARVQSGVMQAAVAVPGVEVIGVCDAYKGRVTRAQERLGSQAKDYGDWRALCSPTSRSTRSSSRPRTTGTASRRWRRSRPARTCTSRSR